MTRLSSRVRLHAPRVPETSSAIAFCRPILRRLISEYMGNSRRHSSISREQSKSSGHRVTNCARALIMSRGGRCYNARAGKLDQALVFAGRVREVADALNNAELRAWCAMNAEPYYYRGLWDEAVLAAEDALPVAWEIGEWAVVVFLLCLAGDGLLEAGTVGQRPADSRSSLQ